MTWLAGAVVRRAAVVGAALDRASDMGQAPLADEARLAAVPVRLDVKRAQQVARRPRSGRRPRRACR